MRARRSFAVISTVGLCAVSAFVFVLAGACGSPSGAPSEFAVSADGGSDGGVPAAPDCPHLVRAATIVVGPAEACAIESTAPTLGQGLPVPTPDDLRFGPLCAQACGDAGDGECVVERGYSNAFRDANPGRMDAAAPFVCPDEPDTGTFGVDCYASEGRATSGCGL